MAPNEYGYASKDRRRVKRKEIEDPTKRLQARFEASKNALRGMASIIGTLEDLFASPKEARRDKDGNMMEFVFWRENGCPSPLLTQLLRSVVEAVKRLLSEGITHWNLEPRCLSVMCWPSSLFPDRPYQFSLVPSEECFKDEHGSMDVQATDIFVALGVLLLFCIEGATGNTMKRRKTSSGHEQKIKKDPDFTALKNIPEAMDLIPGLLDPHTHADKRCLPLEYVWEVRRHPLFWPDCYKFRFIGEASQVVNAKGGPLLESLIRVASYALSGSNDKSDHDDGEKVKEVLKGLEQDLYACHYKTDVLREFDYENERTRYYMTTYPRLFFEVYKVMREQDSDFIAMFMRDRPYG